MRGTYRQWRGRGRGRRQTKQRRYHCAMHVSVCLPSSILLDAWRRRLTTWWQRAMLLCRHKSKRCLLTTTHDHTPPSRQPRCRTQHAAHAPDTQCWRPIQRNLVPPNRPETREPKWLRDGSVHRLQTRERTTSANDQATHAHAQEHKKHMGIEGSYRQKRYTRSGRRAPGYDDVMTMCDAPRKEG